MDLGKEFIKYVKMMPCLVCGKDEVDAHHLQAIGMGNNRKNKTDKDFSCVPLCRIHHTEYHSLGLVDMEKKYRCYRLNFWKEAHHLVLTFLKDSDE